MKQETNIRVLTERPKRSIHVEPDYQYTRLNLHWKDGGQTVSGYDVPERVISLLSGLYPGDEIELILNGEGHIIDAKLLRKATERPRS